MIMLIFSLLLLYGILRTASNVTLLVQSVSKERNKL